jgi:hypothetical protein
MLMIASALFDQQGFHRFLFDFFIVGVSTASCTYSSTKLSFPAQVTAPITISTLTRRNARKTVLHQ